MTFGPLHLNLISGDKEREFGLWGMLFESKRLCKTEGWLRQNNNVKWVFNITHWFFLHRAYWSTFFFSSHGAEKSFPSSKHILSAVVYKMWLAIQLPQSEACQRLQDTAALLRHGSNLLQIRGLAAIARSKLPNWACVMHWRIKGNWSCSPAILR